MSKYSAPPFKVTLMWFQNNKFYKKRFVKYIQAVEWAEKNLNVESIQVKIMGELIFKKGE